MRRWLPWLLLTVIIGYMGWSLVFSDHGYRVYRQEQQQLQALQQQLQVLKQQRQQLAEEILRLRNDPQALEELVHRELGYVHPDEFVLIMPDQKQAEQPAAGTTP